MVCLLLYCVCMIQAVPLTVLALSPIGFWPSTQLLVSLAVWCRCPLCWVSDVLAGSSSHLGTRTCSLGRMMMTHAHTIDVELVSSFAFRASLAALYTLPS
jgi:hypothetical protein